MLALRAADDDRRWPAFWSVFWRVNSLLSTGGDWVVSAGVVVKLLGSVVISALLGED